MDDEGAGEGRRSRFGLIVVAPAVLIGGVILWAILSGQRIIPGSEGMMTVDEAVVVIAHDLWRWLRSL